MAKTSIFIINSEKDLLPLPNFYDTHLILSAFPDPNKQMPEHDTFRVADLDMDGRADVVMADSSGWQDYITGTIGDKYMTVMTGKLGGGFNLERGIGERTRQFTPNSLGFRVADVSGDGMPDVIYGNDATMFVLVNNTDATGLKFLPDKNWGSRKGTYPGDCWYGGPYATFHMADVTGDGKADVVYEDKDRNLRVMSATECHSKRIPCRGGSARGTT